MPDSFRDGINSEYGLELALEHAGTRDQDRGLPALSHSLPLLLKRNGYVIALIGKWHLGYRPEYSPRVHGFDYFYGFKNGAIVPVSIAASAR